MVILVASTCQPVNLHLELPLEHIIGVFQSLLGEGGTTVFPVKPAQMFPSMRRKASDVRECTGRAPPQLLPAFSREVKPEWTWSRAGINHRVGKASCCVIPREYILNLVFEGVGHYEELQSVIACVL